MADQRISALSALLEADVQATTDVLPIADISTAETKKVTPAALVAAGIVGVGPGTINGSVIQAGTITGAQIAANTVTASKLANGAVGTAAIIDGAVTGAKIAADSITAVQIGPDAVGASELADNAVDTNAIQDAAVTLAKLATGSVGTAQLAAGAVDSSKLAPGSVTNAAIGALAVDTTQLADGSVTAPKLAAGAVTSTALASGAVLSTAIANGAVTAAKIAADTITAAQIGPNAIGHSELANGAVDTHALQDLAVTTAKLANGAVDTAQLANGAVDSTKLAAGAVNNAALGTAAVGTTELADGSVTTAKLAPGAVDSSKVAADAVGTTQIADGAVTDAKIAGPIGLDKFASQGAGIVFAGPVTGSAATPAFRALAPTDLPIATGAAVGGVRLAPGGGIGVDAAGNISLSTVATAGTSPVVTYGADGRITSGRALTSIDIPKATASAVGGVMPGAGLSVDGSGALGITNAITAGTNTKVTYNAQGLITAATALTAADIPDLDASKIVSGMLPGSHIASRSITQAKLADYAIAYIQETSPGSISGDHPIGELWFQESTAKLAMWNGNSWMPVGQGALSGQNLRFCGTFDASTGQIKALTTFGTSDGFSVGSAIPAADNKYTGAYFVCDTAGNGTAVTAGVAYDPGDWIVCLGQARGWERIDTLNGGGGGGASTLESLTDVTITAAAAGDVLTYSGTGWINRQANLDPGTY